jgi:hypothetical protein
MQFAFFTTSGLLHLLAEVALLAQARLASWREEGQLRSPTGILCSWVERDRIMNASETSPSLASAANGKLSGQLLAQGVKALLLAGAMAILPCQSASWEDQAQTAALTDGLSTLGGLALGAAEANPIGLLALVAKAPMLAAVKTLPRDEQADWHASFSAIWGAATANNLCIIAAIVSGGAVAPLCPMVGAAWGMQKWSESAMERELWAICREERAYWKNPDMPCDFFDKPSI